MKNVEMTVEGNILTIKVDLTKDFGPSASGKNHIVASTGGNAAIPGAAGLFLGLNTYRSPQATPVVPKASKTAPAPGEALRPASETSRMDALEANMASIAEMLAKLTAPAKAKK